MPSYNLTTTDGLRCIVGHVGREPELKHTQGGKRVAKFSIATNNPKDKTEPPTWHSINCWDSQADEAMNLRKGQVVCVIGPSKTREWEGKQFTDISAWFIGIGFPPPQRTGQHERLPDNQSPVSDDPGPVPF